jgi:hypothetical protein
MKEEIKTKTPDNSLGNTWDWVLDIAEKIVGNVDHYNEAKKLMMAKDGREFTPTSPEGLKNFLHSSILNSLKQEIQDYVHKTESVDLLCREKSSDDDDSNCEEALEKSLSNQWELHCQIMHDLTLLAENYYKAFGEAEWFRPFLSDSSIEVNLPLFSQISGEISRELNARNNSSSNPNYDPRISGDMIETLDRDSVSNWVKIVYSSLVKTN